MSLQTQQRSTCLSRTRPQVQTPVPPRVLEMEVAIVEQQCHAPETGVHLVRVEMGDCVCTSLLNHSCKLPLEGLSVCTGPRCAPQYCIINNEGKRQFQDPRNLEAINCLRPCGLHKAVSCSPFHTANSFRVDLAPRRVGPHPQTSRLSFLSCDQASALLWLLAGHRAESQGG